MVEGAEAVGPDLFAGVRPAFELSAEQGRELLKRHLATDKALAKSNITLAFDPVRATATLTGEVEEPALRRRAERKLGEVWWLSAVENQLSTPSVGPGRLALLGAPNGPISRSRVLAVILDTVPLDVRWADVLPVSGSEWWVNLYGPAGVHAAYKVEPSEIGNDRTLPIAIDRRRLLGAQSGQGGVVSVALSLGAPAPFAGDPRIVSNQMSVPLPPGL